LYYLKAKPKKINDTMFENACFAPVAENVEEKKLIQ
jgi:hypothetical protein